MKFLVPRWKQRNQERQLPVLVQGNHIEVVVPQNEKFLVLQTFFLVLSRLERNIHNLRQMLMYSHLAAIHDIFEK